MAKPLGSPLPADTVHLCVDMQRMFAERTPWHTPWMPRVLPKVERLVAHRPADTIFTRFLPAEKPGDGHGTWKGYWRHWSEMTRSRLAPGMTDVLPSLARFMPPARAIDKTTYSPWSGLELDQAIEGLGATTLVVTGAETDVCVLATVLGAVDRGLRTVVVEDAICSSSDEAHDAMTTLLGERYDRHVEIASTDDVLAAWTARSVTGADGSRVRRIRPEWSLG